MTAAAIGAVHYSVEKWFSTNWTATGFAVGGQEYDQGSATSWIAVYVLAQVGQPTRAGAYGATVLLSVNVFSTVSQRAVRDTAQTLEGLLRGKSIAVYGPVIDGGDLPDYRNVIGYVRLHDPEFKAPRKDGALHAGTVDCRGTLDMEV